MDFKLNQLIFHLPCAFSVSKIFGFRFLLITPQAQKSIQDCSGIFSVEETIQFQVRVPDSALVSLFYVNLFLAFSNFVL